MLRKIIKINETLCNGCRLCVDACHEGAIDMIDGKARLLRDDYCDGLGDCLPVCPTGAISFEEREAAAYDEQAVQALKQEPLPCGCPGTHAKKMARVGSVDQETSVFKSQLQQWPIQIKLVPANATYLHQAKLLIAADCTAYAYANFHQEFMKDKITLIGCPKLDNIDYSEKLTAILKANEIHSITVIRMEVPCCGGIEQAVKTAMKNSNSWIPWQVITITTEGNIKE